MYFNVSFCVYLLCRVSGILEQDLHTGSCVCVCVHVCGKQPGSFILKWMACNGPGCVANMGFMVSGVQ